MNRRRFLLAAAATMASMSGGISLTSASAPKSLTLPLWHDTPPGGGGPTGETLVNKRGALSRIAVPLLTVLTPDSPNGHGVLIAAGGGYTRIEIGKEAWPAAQWLVARGYTAYILRYRLPNEGWTDGNKVSLQDAQRALRIIRQREKQISVLGFSAGGHLLGMAAARPDFRSYPARDALDELSPTVDRAALIYPIITLEKPYSHTSTHKILVGPQASESAEAMWSIQNYVTPQMPPVFLVQAEDDPISDPHNSLIMYSACLHHHVPVEMYRYPNGGHGFGLGRQGTPTTQWPTHYEKWLTE